MSRNFLATLPLLGVAAISIGVAHAADQVTCRNEDHCTICEGTVDGKPYYVKNCVPPPPPPEPEPEPEPWPEPEPEPCIDMDANDICDDEEEEEC